MSVTVTPYFNPTSITGCRLWLDGADPLGTGVPPANASSLSTWFDKSGNGFNATANGTAATYNTNAVVFAGAQNYGTSLSSTMLTQSAFAVISYTGSAYMDIISVRSISGTAGLQQIITSGTQRITSYGGALVVTGSAVTASTIVLYNYTFNSGVSTFIYLNGTQTGTSTGSSISGSGTISIGSYDNNGSLEPFTGNMYELIIFNVVLTTTQRQQVESYLAQKWNFTSSLPVGHPGRNAILYRSSIPTPVKVTPYSFPASTIVYTGSFIPYTVPAACTSLTFNMWGAGGSGGNGNPGGGGAYLTGRIAVTSGEVLQLIVGKGGQFGTATQWSTMTNAEGGGGGGGGLSGQGGQGGGRTAIQKLISASYTEVVTAGGGGSAGGNAGTYGGNAHFSGTSQSAGTTYGQGRVPTGGSATAGGLNTFTARVGFPWDGTQFTGGFASNAFNVSPVTGPCGGGGGGGGYYGGGGGGRSGADTYGGGGGGSYYNSTFITSFSGSNGTSNVAVASGIAGYITGCGRGGNSGSTNNGSNGVIVITPVSPNPIAAFIRSFISGGSSSANGIYTVMTFSNPGGTLVVNKSISATILVVGAGGGGGSAGTQTGGGGAGGAVFVSSPVTISAGSYAVTVGTGGGINTNGGNSTILSYTGVGGGGGGNWINGAGKTGGCGGGGSGEGGSGAAGSQGFAGAGGRGQFTCGGGGGGMGQAGKQPSDGSPSSGGNGLQYSITGSSVYYAGGGAGGFNGASTGGLGGGGDKNTQGTDGLGGGGGSGARGGHGIVIISYVFV